MGMYITTVFLVSGLFFNALSYSIVAVFRNLVYYLSTTSLPFHNELYQLLISLWVSFVAIAGNSIISIISIQYAFYAFLYVGNWFKFT